MNHTPSTTVSLSIGSTPNNATVSIGVLDLHFSYRTVIAFSSPLVNDGQTVVRVNAWGPTTGKHLNAIDGGTPDAKKRRLDGDSFQRLLNIALAPLHYDAEVHPFGSVAVR